VITDIKLIAIHVYVYIDMNIHIYIFMLILIHVFTYTDFELLSPEEIADMKLIAVKIRASGQSYVAYGRGRGRLALDDSTYIHTYLYIHTHLHIKIYSFNDIIMIYRSILCGVWQGKRSFSVRR
jgi:hypothetical protein